MFAGMMQSQFQKDMLATGTSNMLRSSRRDSGNLATFKNSLLQWNLSIEATIGNQLAVLYKEVSLIQR